MCSSLYLLIDRRVWLLQVLGGATKFCDAGGSGPLLASGYSLDWTTGNGGWDATARLTTSSATTAPNFGVAPFTASAAAAASPAGGACCTSDNTAVQYSSDGDSLMDVSDGFGCCFGSGGGGGSDGGGGGSAASAYATLDDFPPLYLGGAPSYQARKEPTLSATFAPQIQCTPLGTPDHHRRHGHSHSHDVMAAPPTSTISLSAFDFGAPSAGAISTCGSGSELSVFSNAPSFGSSMSSSLPFHVAPLDIGAAAAAAAAAAAMHSPHAASPLASTATYHPHHHHHATTASPQQQQRLSNAYSAPAVRAAAAATSPSPIPDALECAGMWKDASGLFSSPHTPPPAVHVSHMDMSPRSGSTEAAAQQAPKRQPAGEEDRVARASLLAEDVSPFVGACGAAAAAVGSHYPQQEGAHGRRSPFEGGGGSGRRGERQARGAAQAQQQLERHDHQLHGRRQARRRCEWPGRAGGVAGAAGVRHERVQRRPEPQRQPQAARPFRQLG